MEKNQYDLCIEVLRRFNSRDLFDGVILIGSWCMPFYKEYFAGVKYRSTIKTRDVDFLVPHPGKIRVAVDIPELLKDLGFVIGYRGTQGYMRLEHPDLVVEFLSPEKGRGTDKPVPLPRLRMNATALRFLNFLAQETIKVKVADFHVFLPHPANFALHKLMISQRRQKEDKASKDRIMALEILNALLKKGEAGKIKTVFCSVPSKWQKKILGTLTQEKEMEILEILQ